MNKRFLTTILLSTCFVMLSACEKTPEKSKEETVKQTTEVTKQTAEHSKTSESKEKAIEFTEEELIAAFYLDSFVDKKDKERDTIEKSYSWLVDAHPGEVHFRKEKDDYILDYSTKGSRMHYKINKDKIEERGEYDDVSEVLKTYTKDELIEKYHDKLPLIKDFLAISKNNQKVAEKDRESAKIEEESKKSLSEEEMINWAKRAMNLKMGESEDASKSDEMGLEYHVFKDKENVYNDPEPNLDHINASIPQSDSIGQFRITSSGALESHESKSGKGLLDMEWMTVSDSYMDMTKGKAYYNSKKSAEPTVDGKNLTAEQAISWVKNHLKSNGATEAELSDTDFKSQMSDDGYLTIDMYTWNPAHTGKTRAYTYRINGSGQLQEGDVYNANGEWQTVSDNYIGN